MEPFVSVIIPARDEETFIDKCLESFLGNDYPHDRFEIIVVDGESHDRTREIVSEYCSRDSRVRLLTNPEKITPVARNIGIKNSRGDFIMIFDAHSAAPKDYISKCINHIVDAGADNVGGVMETAPKDGSLKARVIAGILSSPFGVGGSRFRTGVEKPEEVDTVPFGCYRREVFDRLGLFNEKLHRNQDIEFNLRLKRNGGKILLFPDIKLTYFARATFIELWKNNFSNGFWVIYATKFARAPFSIRHLIPFFFVLFLLLGTPVALLTGGPLETAYTLLLCFYFLLDGYFSYRMARRMKRIPVFFQALYGFFLLHFSYGLGSLRGMAKLITGGKK